MAQILLILKKGEDEDEDEDENSPQTADNKPQTANSPGPRRRIDFDWLAGRIILFSL
jgi:hypothetical protein